MAKQQCYSYSKRTRLSEPLLLLLCQLELGEQTKHFPHYQNRYTQRLLAPQKTTIDKLLLLLTHISYYVLHTQKSFNATL